MGKVGGPEPLTQDHQVSQFNCGNDTLNEWLKKRALKNQERGASRTFVISSRRRVMGYYALASGSVERRAVPSAVSRNMPEPIPVTVLGRLAIDVECQGQRLGSALLKDAMLRTVAVSKNIGIRGILVHAISNEAKAFYAQYGFTESPIDPMMLILSVVNMKSHYEP